MTSGRLPIYHIHGAGYDPKPAAKFSPSGWLSTSLAAGTADLLIYNIGLISVGVGITYIQRDGQALYPDANNIGAIALGAILMGIVCVALWLWTNVVPRSGAPFTFLAQPGFRAVAFALSFVECVGWVYYLAITTTLVVNQVAIPMAAIFGGPNCAAVHLLSTSGARFVAGSLTLLLAVVLLQRGMQAFWRSQRIVFVLAVLGTLALLVALAQDRTQFQHNFNALYPQLGANPYRAVIDQAHAWKFAACAPKPLKRTVALMVWPFLSLLGAVFSMGVAGETRSGAKGQLPAMLGSLLVGAFCFITVAMLAHGSLGNGFQGAIAYNYDNHPANSSATFSTPFDPNLCYLACVATNSAVLRIFIGLGFLCWIWFWIPGVLVYTSRSVSAWTSIRDAAPKMSSRTAVIVVAIFAEVLLALQEYTHLSNAMVLILPLIACWFGALLMGAALPIVAPDVYKSSRVSGWKIGGVAVMPVVCFAGAAVLGGIFYLLWRDSDAAGHTSKSLVTIAGLFAVALVVYFWSKPRGSGFTSPK